MRHLTEAVGLTVSALYGLFILHYLFPGAYARLMSWLANLWANAHTLFERIPSTDRLNKMWDVGGTE